MARKELSLVEVIHDVTERFKPCGRRLAKSHSRPTK